MISYPNGIRSATGSGDKPERGVIMERLAIHLALHGAIVLTISILCGLFLYLAILNKKQVSAWHLVHSSGTARGIMLIALAAIISYPVFPYGNLRHWYG